MVNLFFAGLITFSVRTYFREDIPMDIVDISLMAFSGMPFMFIRYILITKYYHPKCDTCDNDYKLHLIGSFLKCKNDRCESNNQHS